jgi:predicted dehydrogenase
VGYTYRRNPAIAAIHNHVRNGEFGDLSLFYGRYLADYACDPGGPFGWRYKGGLAFDVQGIAGRASLDFHRPAEYIVDDAQPRRATGGGRQVIVGPQMPYFRDGYPMQAAGLGGGYAEMFTYQTRAFLDQVTGAADPLPPNASFADGLHTMAVIQAVVKSSEAGGASVPVS